MMQKKLPITVALLLFSNQATCNYEYLSFNNLFYKTWGLLTFAACGFAIYGTGINCLLAYDRHIAYIDVMDDLKKDGITWKDKFKDERDEHLLYTAVFLAIVVPLLGSSYKFFTTKAH
jgi:hypothetical protein